MPADEDLIRRCLELAERGRGKVSPNPMVGAVIVKKGEIISEGWHELFGGPHAEINAIFNVYHKIQNSTLYINLEPCSHHGKTPPCTEVIIKSGIKKVVLGAGDPNPLVAGKGIQRLRDNGIEVVTGVLENECREFNRHFIKYITTKEPYITLKIAQTIDGKIADMYGDSKWITSEESRAAVQKIRSEHDAILVGINTVLKDDPLLTVRGIAHIKPYRIILDPTLKFPLNARMLKDNAEKNIIIFAGKEAEEKRSKISALQKAGAEIIFTQSDGQRGLNLRKIIRILGKRNISSVLVEGGSKIFSSFIRKNIADEIIIFTAPKLLGSGMQGIADIGISRIAKAQEWRLTENRIYGGDIFARYRKISKEK